MKVPLPRDILSANKPYRRFFVLSVLKDCDQNHYSGGKCSVGGTNRGKVLCLPSTLSK